MDNLIKALEIDAQGDWDTAHRIVQKYNSIDACWIHAYLHRKEGDLGNAGYWYSRAHRTMPSHTLEEEWQEIKEYLENK